MVIFIGFLLSAFSAGQRRANRRRSRLPDLRRRLRLAAIMIMPRDGVLLKIRLTWNGRTCHRPGRRTRVLAVRQQEECNAMDDPFNLQRFLDAQAPVHTTAHAELAAGRKRSHWMWFIFPQISGLGSSAVSRFYAIASRQEAEAYLRHPVLGPRLRACTQLVNAVQGRSAYDIFGDPDCMKFHSCMTLFAEVAEDDAVFREALAKYYGGAPDQATLARL
jgi:uncharacterized protein (DUF1810 family)